ncbi:MAG: hypothetical protein ACD_20C00171G0002 [uncultured bacterium]|nr:MAG: hypothetical protein ACD_20C00171G0002 [uncultured bacterium]
MSNKKENLEAVLLGNDLSKVYEDEMEDKIEKEITQARELREKEANREKYEVIITDLKLISAEKRFDKQSIYRVFNRKQKTETFVNGEQAENMLKYSDDYVIKFDHRVEYQ